jgi:hypothetical protein
MKTPLKFICHALCNSFLSIIDGPYSSLSETRDWTWGALKLLLRLVSIDFHELNIPVVGLGHSVPFITKVKKVCSSVSNPSQGYNDLLQFEPSILQATRVRRSLLQYIL